MSNEKIVEIRSEADIVIARRMARELAADLGFSPTETTMIVTALSELARNIVSHARNGRIRLGVEQNGAAQGLVVVASDEGPGIIDLVQAMQDGYSTSGGLGLGLAGAKRLMDDFHATSSEGGTVITAKKWRR